MPVETIVVLGDPADVVVSIVDSVVQRGPWFVVIRTRRVDQDTISWRKRNIEATTLFLIHDWAPSEGCVLRPLNS
jgi:hypothetical protein